MAEVGLLALARTAWEVGVAVLPPYRTRFSKHPFTQPKLLAILCLMRYEDWTFREARRLTDTRRDVCPTRGRFLDAPSLEEYVERGLGNRTGSNQRLWTLATYFRRLTSTTGQISL